MACRNPGVTGTGAALHRMPRWNPAMISRALIVRAAALRKGCLDGMQLSLLEL